MLSLCNCTLDILECITFLCNVLKESRTSKVWLGIFTSSNVFRGMHYGECKHCSLIASHTMPFFPIMHPPLLMHYLLQNPLVIDKSQHHKMRWGIFLYSQWHFGSIPPSHHIDTRTIFPRVKVLHHIQTQMILIYKNILKYPISKLPQTNLNSSFSTFKEIVETCDTSLTLVCTC